MAGSISGAKLISLKIIIDTETDKVVFAEAEKDFVDFIFHLLSLPLATIVSLLHESKTDMVGSVGDLYKSMASLEDEYLETNLNKNSLLNPTAPSFNSSPSPTVCGFNFSPIPNASESGTKEYVKRPMRYMVTDNLEVKPMSVSLIIPLLKDFSPLVEKQVQLSPQKEIAILKASLETKSVLTTVFLGTEIVHAKDSKTPRR